MVTGQGFDPGGGGGKKSGRAQAGARCNIVKLPNSTTSFALKKFGKEPGRKVKSVMFLRGFVKKKLFYPLLIHCGQ